MRITRWGKKIITPSFTKYYLNHIRFQWYCLFTLRRVCMKLFQALQKWTTAIKLHDFASMAFFRGSIFPHPKFKKLKISTIALGIMFCLGLSMSHFVILDVMCSCEFLLFYEPIQVFRINMYDMLYLLYFCIILLEIKIKMCRIYTGFLIYFVIFSTTVENLIWSKNSKVQTKQVSHLDKFFGNNKIRKVVQKT